MSPGNDSVLIKKNDLLLDNSRGAIMWTLEKSNICSCATRSHLIIIAPSLNTAKQLSAVFSRLKVSLLNQYLTLKET